MHFRVIKDDFFNRLFLLLKETVPEFITPFDESDSIYLTLGEFGRFMISNSEKKEIMAKSFKFINTALENGGHETEDAIVIELFEQFYNHDQLIIEANQHLTGKSLNIFTKYRPIA